MGPRTLLALALAAPVLAACDRPAAPAPPAAATAPPAATAHAAATAIEDRPYEVSLEPPAGARAGVAASARVTIRATGGFHVNGEYPTAFRPEPGSAAAFGGDRVALGEGADWTPCAAHAAEACTLSAPLPFTLRAPGEARLAGTLAFSVCNPELCRIEKVPLSMAVTAAR